MKTLRKYLSVFLCLCISAYAVPSFAVTASSAPEFYKAELSDVELDKAVGASGSVDANLADYTVRGSKATAVFANRSSLQVTYSLDVVNINGAVLENLATGYLSQSSAILVSGIPTVAENYRIQARTWNSGVPGLESKDSSWASEW